MGLTRGIDRRSAELSLAYVLIAYLAFGIAALAGVVQGMERGGVIKLPAFVNYYEILTAHGVLMGLVFTTFFIVGFLFSGLAKTTSGLTEPGRKLGWIGWALMVFGTTMDVACILTNNASVLYTFYAPLRASGWFYVGATLLIVGSWLAGYGMFHTYAAWRKNNKGRTSPLFAFMAVATMVLWQIATLGVAAEVLLQLIPWSFGWVPTVNVLLSRTLFWFFGHPLVYFWLLPAYTAWYVCVPEIIGGKVFSDSLARLAFLMFILLSTPVGFHHQLMEPGLPAHWKFIHVVLTMFVVIPSMLTAFSLFAMYERYGRKKGAKGLFGWFNVLPWKDARFCSLMVGMLLFIPAGIGGIINASNEMNTVVHNTIWVTGHFHLTVATSVALTFFGTSYWLLPTLTGRTLTKAANRWGIIQTIVWTVGMLIMSGAMHFMGLLGVPRRTDYTTYLDDPTALSWMPYETLMAIGGIILFVGAVIMIALVIYLTWFAPRGYTEYPIGQAGDPMETTPQVFEKWKLWIGLAMLLVVLAYAYPIADVIMHHPPGQIPMKTW